MKFPKKVDDNQKEIVNTLRKLGFSIVHLHELGKGCPDLLCGKNGLNYLVEIKDGKKALSKQKLTNDQINFHKNWLGQVKIINSIDDCINFSKECM